MPVTALTHINPVCFLSELDRIELLAPGESSVEFAVSSGSVIFRNSYIPDADGRITIYDISKVIEPYLDVDDPLGVRFTFTANDVHLVAGPSPTCQVIPCRVAVSEPAARFVTDFFLTPVMSHRNTCVGRHEVVTPACASGEAVTVTADYFDGLHVVSRIFDLGINSGHDAIDVSPAQFVDETLGRLIGYRVSCGHRKARYRVMKSMPQGDPALIFRNSFGCWETIYLCGVKKQTPRFTRSTAMTADGIKLYDIDEEMQWKASTGVLSGDMERVAIDLARSKSVFLMDTDGSAGAEVVITDSDNETSNADNELRRMSFTFRRAARRSSLLTPVRPPRVFDATFDEHFS